MTNQILKTQTFMERVVEKSNDTQIRKASPDRLTVVSLAMNGLKRFYEGYFGKERIAAAMREGADLRRKDPKAYEAAIARNRRHTVDMRSMGTDARLVERITSSDLTYAIGATRDIEEADPRPTFQTELFRLVRRRTRTDLTPITTAGGVDLADRFLAVRAEGSTHKKTSWVGRGEDYSMYNLELGFELTWEAILNNKLDEWDDALFELGQDAARTRAWLVLDAIRRAEPALILPDGAFGPNIANLTAADAYLGNRVIDGRTYSSGATDLFVPRTQRATAALAIGATSVATVGGANGAVQQVPNINPVAGLAEIHSEEIMAETVGMPDGFSTSDWILADARKQPVEFAALAPFAAGPRLLTRIPEVVELADMGSFGPHVLEVKVSDFVGAKVRDKSAVRLISGRGPQ